MGGRFKGPPLIHEEEPSTSWALLGSPGSREAMLQEEPW